MSAKIGKSHLEATGERPDHPLDDDPFVVVRTDTTPARHGEVGDGGASTSTGVESARSSVGPTWTRP